MNNKIKKGFTLVELLMVLAIVGLLASILIPTAGSIRESTLKTICKSQLSQSLMLLCNSKVSMAIILLHVVVKIMSLIYPILKFPKSLLRPCQGEMQRLENP